MAAPDGLTGDVDCIRPAMEPDASWADDPEITARATESVESDPELVELLGR
jgi:hypothetical protein